VHLCRSEDATACAGAGNWASGWLVFVPDDPARPSRVGPGSEVLRFNRPRYRGRIEANRAVFIFRPGDSRSTNGTVIFCDPRGGSASRAVIISHTGRPRGSAYSAAGTALPC
jgi:type IV fimbrial biogenesis protein FimT